MYEYFIIIVIGVLYTDKQLPFTGGPTLYGGARPPAGYAPARKSNSLKCGAQDNAAPLHFAKQAIDGTDQFEQHCPKEANIHYLYCLFKFSFLWLAIANSVMRSIRDA